MNILYVSQGFIPSDLSRGDIFNFGDTGAFKNKDRVHKSMLYQFFVSLIERLTMGLVHLSLGLGDHQTWFKEFDAWP